MTLEWNIYIYIQSYLSWWLQDALNLMKNGTAAIIVKVNQAGTVDCSSVQNIAENGVLFHGKYYLWLVYDSLSWNIS